MQICPVLRISEGLGAISLLGHILLWSYMFISWHVYVSILLTSGVCFCNEFSNYSNLLHLFCIAEWSWSVQTGFLVDEAKQGNVLQERTSRLPVIDWHSVHPTGLEQVWRKTPNLWVVLMWSYQHQLFYTADAEPPAERRLLLCPSLTKP